MSRLENGASSQYDIAHIAKSFERFKDRNKARGVMTRSEFENRSRLLNYYGGNEGVRFEFAQGKFVKGDRALLLKEVYQRAVDNPVLTTELAQSVYGSSDAFKKVSTVLRQIMVRTDIEIDTVRLKRGRGYAIGYYRKNVQEQ